MKHLSCKGRRLLMVCFTCLLTYTGWSQQNNRLKAITPREYYKWYSLENGGLSAAGSWLSYSLYYTDSQILVIQQTYGDTKYVLENASGMKFLGDSIASYSRNEQGYLLFLNSGREEVFPSGAGFQLSKNEQCLMIFHRPAGKLVLRQLQHNDSLVLTRVSDYHYNPASESVCVLSLRNDALKMDIISTGKDFHVKNIPIPENREVLEISWHESGNFLAFTLGRLRHSNDTTDAGLVGYFDLPKEKSRYLNPAEKGNFPRGHILTSRWNYPLAFSPDGKQVFFAHRPAKLAQNNEIPEVWITNDPYVKLRKSIWKYNLPKVSMWQPAGDKYIQVTDQHTPEAFYGLGKDFALVYDPTQYRLQNDPSEDISDVFLLNLESGEKILLIKNFVNTIRSINISPSGRYVLYLLDKQWWCYDTQKHLHKNLTLALEKVSGIESPEDPVEFSPEGWTQHEEAVYMYDRYDLWKIATGNASCERITQGREKNVQYRLIINDMRSQSDMHNNRGIYIIDQVLFFQTRKGDSMGYACKKADGGMVHIVLDTCYTRRPVKASNNSIFGFSVENATIPPRIMVYDAFSDTLMQVFQSNPHYKAYRWHEQKMISYRNKDGKKLSGILYYPMDYRQDSLYPMVVHVYEKQSQRRNQYIVPTYNNPIGFNVTNLTADGYFVFLPDIEYETGEPGFSAADCIISGTKAAMESAPVIPAKIGLMGQSFGGYETMFTITQTRLFATAIAGAGISNLPTDYFNIEGMTLRFRQYENDQLRMKKSLFDDYQGYLDNSPQYHAHKIMIPFLVYTGGKDYHVHYTQTMAFHFAMRRLGRQNTMLIYPNEAHAFNDPVNKKDLTIKVHQWFGHYLKGAEKQSWMP